MFYDSKITFLESNVESIADKIKLNRVPKGEIKFSNHYLPNAMDNIEKYLSKVIK